MLSSIFIRNFTIIRDLTVDFGGGMSALTGETGAGKSIVVDALALALGGRADAGGIRHGEDAAEVSAAFTVDDAADARQWLDEHQLGDGDGAECVLRRVLFRDKPSRAFINGRPVNLRQLRDLGILLADIHGQSEHQALLRPGQQRRMVDDYRGSHAELKKLAELHSRHAELERAVGELSLGGESAGERVDYLEYQIREIEQLDLAVGAVEKLEEEFKRLANAGDLAEGLQRAVDMVDGEDPRAAAAAVAAAKRELQRLVQFDKSLEAAVAMLDEAEVNLSEAAAQLRAALAGAGGDPRRLREVEARIGVLHDLGRKHKVAPKALPQKLRDLAAERDRIAGGAERAEALRREMDQNLAAYGRLAESLSKKRRRAAAELGKAVSAEMRQLGLAGSVFEARVAFAPGGAPTAHGWDQVEFLLSANPGQPPRPLNKVASGGELSRISLAVRVACAAPGPIPTLVFDEADTGTGGRVAGIVGEKLRGLAGRRQVLCITHLPQVAAHGHHHLQVTKHNRAPVTVSVETLGGDARVREIGRMLGGRSVTAKTLEHAREMLGAGGGRKP